MNKITLYIIGLSFAFVLGAFVLPKNVIALVCKGTVACFKMNRECTTECDIGICPTECRTANPSSSCFTTECIDKGCSGSETTGGTCSVASNCGPVCYNGCNIYENFCEIDSGGDPGPTPTSGPGPGGGGGGCGAQCNSVSDCSISGAQNPACSNNVCWDAAACGGGGGGNNCDFQFTCPDGRQCGEGYACYQTSEGPYTCNFRTECAVCGDGRCTRDNDKETCNNCAIDCGLCPGTLRGRAMVVGKADTSCAAVYTSTTGLDNTRIRFTRGNNSWADNQDKKSYVTFSRPGGTYTASATPRGAYADYRVVRACWTSDMGTPSGEGTTQQLSPDETLVWNFGVVPPGPWFQATGGDVYGKMTLRSLVTSGADPRLFILDGAGTFPGIAQYDLLYDFNPSDTSQGETQVSTRNWLVDEGNDNMDLYDTFYNKLGAPTTPDAFANLGALALPASRATPYYIVGDVTTSGNWSVGSGQNVILIIDGNLNLNGRINISGSGFFAAIVSENITITPTIGHPIGSNQYDVEGMYITSGTFQTGTSGAATEQLTVRGTVVAESVLLQRDLDSVGRNHEEPAEKFIYNPELLLRMPETMKDVPVFWQEVAP